MKKGWIIGGVIALLVLVAISINFGASKAQAEEDKASLKAQKAAAGGAGGGMAGVPPGMGDMAKELKLTPTQQKQMQEAQSNMFKQMAAFNKGGNPQDAMKQMPEVMKAQQERMAKILTPEQQKKMQAAMQSRMGSGFPGGPPPGGGFPRGGFPGGAFPGGNPSGAGNPPSVQGGK
jgi:Spy/CpxP family protein refolding chaperone